MLLVHVALHLARRDGLSATSCPSMASSMRARQRRPTGSQRSLDPARPVPR